MATRKMSRQEAGRKGAKARWGSGTLAQRRRPGRPPGRKAMSRQEAGQRGGQAVAKKYGPEFYEEIGRKGGRRVAAEYYQDIGKRGGETVARRYGPEYYQDIGRKGGEAVSREYGPDHYREIGSRGGNARWDKNKEEVREKRRPAQKSVRAGIAARRQRSHDKRGRRPARR